MKSSKIIAASAALGVLVAAAALAADPVLEGHISITPADIKWTEASLGPGTQIAVLEGDPKQAAPFTMRLKVPPNFKIHAHTHPVFERVTVMSGTFYLGIGEEFDSAKAKAYPTGSVTMMPPGMPMFAYTTDEEAILQLHGTGPWGIDYLHPEEDPRKK